MKKRSSTKSKIDIEVKALTPAEKLVLGFVLVVASVTQSWHFFTAWKMKAETIEFSQFHDALWHIALIKELSRSFPPQHPGLAGEILSNYHYLTDLLLAIVHKFTTIPVETLYIHVAPPLVSAFFAFAAFKLAQLLSRSNETAIIATIFTVFTGSAAYFIPVFLGKGVAWTANSFMLDQPFDQLTNVHTVLGFAMFLTGTFFLVRFNKFSKLSDGILAGMIIGLATGIKAYAGAVGVAALMITLGLELTILKKRKMILPSAIAASIFLLLTVFTSSSNQSPLQFAPGWILTKMVEDSNRFYYEKWSQLEAHYREAGNIIRVAQIKTQELVLYIIGNLGVRLIGFIWIIKKLKKLKHIKAHEIFLIVTIIISLTIPLIFVQPVSVYNTIQFSPYALMILSIVVVLETVTWRKNILMLTLLFLLSLPTTLQTFLIRLKPEYIMSKNEYTALKAIENTPEDAVFLTPPTGEHFVFMKVPGIGGRRTYFSGETFAILTDTDYQLRKSINEEFFRELTDDQRRNQILEDAKITHIYTDESTYTEFLEELEEGRFPIKAIYTQDKFAIFKRI